ncbi:MAG: hypothetical protein WBA74_04485, partial [Cyclobacteriaceae bacterium]
MNKQKFIELLREPATISKDDISGLENTLRQYPYFQSAHLLLAKGSRLTKDPKTKKRISIAAVYCTDRTLLKKYISGDLIFLDSVKKPPINIEEELPEKKIKSFKKPVEKVAKTTDDSSVSAKENSAEASQTDAKDKNFNADNILNEIQNELASYKENKKHFEEYVQNEDHEFEIEDSDVPEDLDDQQSLTSEVSESKETSEQEINEPAEEHTEAEQDEPVEKEMVNHTEDKMPVENDMEFDISGIIAEIKKDEELKQKEEKQARGKEQESSASTEKSKPEVATTSEKSADTTPANDDSDAKSDKVHDEAARNESEKKEAQAAKMVISGSNRSRKKADNTPQSSKAEDPLRKEVKPKQYSK